jgi:hypothetical protein
MLFVAGCHRSGTSFLARLLRSTADRIGLGNALQDESSLLPPTFDNKLGYYESRTLMAADERILEAFDCSWDRPWLQTPDFAADEARRFLVTLRSTLPAHISGDFWIDKDPRLCLTREAFRHIFSREVPVLAILRHPMEVARSLHARDGFAIERGLALWALYNVALLCREGSEPEHCFDYGDFACPASGPLEALHRVLHRLWQPWMNHRQVGMLTAELLREVGEETFVGSLNRQRSPALPSPRQASSPTLLAEATQTAWLRLKELMWSDQLSAQTARQALEPVVMTVLAQPQEIRGWLSQADVAHQRLKEIQELKHRQGGEHRRCQDLSLQLGALEQTRAELQLQLSGLEQRLEWLHAHNCSLKASLHLMKTRAAERRQRIHVLQARLAWNRAALVATKALLGDALDLLHRVRRRLAPRLWP